MKVSDPGFAARPAGPRSRITTEFSVEGICGSASGHITSGALHRIGPVEAGPVAAVNSTVCVPFRVWNAIVAIWNVYSVAELTGGLFGSRSESTMGSSMVFEERLNGLYSLDGSSIDEIAVFVVLQSDLLRFAERLQRAVAVVHLRDGATVASTANSRLTEIRGHWQGHWSSAARAWNMAIRERSAAAVTLFGNLDDGPCTVCLSCRIRS